MVDALAAFGARQDDVDAARERGAKSDFEVLPPNWSAVQLFLALTTQWRCVGLGTMTRSQIVRTGIDYVAIPNGQPFDPANGQVEVAEVFGYVCPACNMFQPVVRAWKASLPADVRFTYVPAQFGGTWDRYARAYYAADAMGLVPRTHDLLYNAIHLEQTLKGERGEDSVQDIAAFYARFGADPQQFASTMSSFAIDGKLRKAKQFAQRSGIEGTPTLVIDGKYRVLGKTREDELRIADQLIAQERAALGKH